MNSDVLNRVNEQNKQNKENEEEVGRPTNESQGKEVSEKTLENLESQK